MPFPVDPAHIRAAEEKLSVRFPGKFVASMTEMNGGDVEVARDVWQLYPVLDRSDRKRIARTCNDVCHETAYLRDQWVGFPAGAVAIAGNGTGDQLVMLPDPNDPNTLGAAVFVWDHETGTLGKPVDFGEVRRVRSNNQPRQSQGLPN